MKSLTVNRREFLSAIDLAVSVLPSKTIDPILAFAKCEVDGNAVEITATDNEVCMSTVVTCESNGKFGLLVPAQRLRQVLGMATDETAQLDLDDGKLVVTCSGVSKMPTADPAEYKAVSKPDFKDYWTTPAKPFCDAFDLCSVAIEPSATRYAIGGVLFCECARALLATDSRRCPRCNLAMDTIGDVGKHDQPSLSTVLPVKFGKAVAKADGDSVDIYCTENRVVARRGSSVIQSPLMQGRFPDYRKLYDCTHETSTAIPAGPFAVIVRRAAVFTAEETFGVSFSFGDGSLTLESSATDKGSGVYSMPIAIDGDPVTVDLNPQYVLDFLSRLKPESLVDVKLISSNQQVVLASGDWSYVLMPLARD